MQKRNKSPEGERIGEVKYFVKPFDKLRAGALRMTEKRLPRCARNDVIVNRFL